MKISLIRYAVLVSIFLSGCASTIQVKSLSKPVNALDTITVSQFRYANESFGLNSGQYKIEFESDEGYYYRGPGLAVQVAPALNTNKENYPDSKFPGGLFISKSPSVKDYRIYYYQLNLAGSPGPTAESTEVTQAAGDAPASNSSGASAPIVTDSKQPVGLLIEYMIESGRGQIVLCPPTKEINIASFTSRP